MGTNANRALQAIRLDGTTYTLTISIQPSFIENYESISFELLQRNTENSLTLTCERTVLVDGYYQYEVMVEMKKVIAMFPDEEILDLVIVRSNGEDENHSRIKSNYDNMEFLRIQLGDNMIFYPGTTKMGNLSFYKKEEFFLAKIQEVDVTADAILMMTGMFLPPKGVKIAQLNLLIKLHEDEWQSVPIQQEKMDDSYAGSNWYRPVSQNGISAKVDLQPYMMEKESSLKFYIEATLESGEILQSQRVKVNHLGHKFPVQVMKKMGNRKYRITVKPTKRSRYLSVSISEYKFVSEMKRSTRDKWVSIRRSKQLLKLFTFAFKVLGIVFPADKKLVMFESFHGKQYSDNPRAIYEYMRENNPDYKLVWSFDRRHIGKFQDLDISMVRRFSVPWLLLMTRANYWVTNARLPLWIPKPKHTIYLQTWHGTPLKRLAADMEEVHMPGTNTEKYKENFVSEAAKWDYLISPNQYSSKIFRRAFQFEQEMVESGYPRNDFLYQANTKESIQNIKAKLGIGPEKKVILYAPTWRDNQFYSKGKYKFNLELDLTKMQAEFGETHVIVLRLHYLVSENLDISDYEGFVYDYSNQEDIRDLYLISDMLITDYSSVFFDYANLKRPVFFFVYDMENYRDNLRGFYFDFEKKAPGPLTRTTEELIHEIKRIAENEFTFDEEFYNRFCYLEDGFAAKRVVERVFH
ncbi:CDP-glycerol glycerophosphotransferase family protein [Ornithinibacillus scapharcae]|uniref:CDP-glycerol glycerophosphotransferase family protein n=1 Tax=Ornithinibacillus scapharcae TaxID=1147159 RepID=UPI000225B9ED|nr:CDP-glycerol glycerophosphotransferase family protein [Ornithinibacillus scapharcae]